MGTNANRVVKIRVKEVPRTFSHWREMPLGFQRRFLLASVHCRHYHCICVPRHPSRHLRLCKSPSAVSREADAGTPNLRGASGACLLPGENLAVDSADRKGRNVF